MFGSNNDQGQDSSVNPVPGASVTPAANDSGSPSFGMNPPHQDSSTSLPPEPTASPHSDVSTAPHLEDNTASDTTGPSSLPPVEDPSPSDNSSSSPVSDDLIAIKQDALSQLSPIVGHLDQSPEDKFKTLMMMIQANDNQDLIKDAYAAAQEIPDEKAKSQALLDVVNEINYFTQKDKSDS